jgi:8-oxo-dGTP diphosphatase
MFRQAARAIVIHDDKVLLMYREKNGKSYYSIPGGKVEGSEDLEQTVEREINEETSIKVRVEKLLGSFEDEKKGKAQHIFLCSYIEGSPSLKSDSVERGMMNENPNNLFKPEWVPTSKIPELTIKPTVCADFFKNFIVNY